MIMITSISGFTFAFLAVISTTSVFKTTEAVSSTYDTHRKLDNEYEAHLKEEHEEHNEEPTDLSNFNIIFDKCERIEELSDNIDLDNKMGLRGKDAMNQFITFLVCPSGFDNNREDCETHEVGIEDYLQITVEYEENTNGEMCELCNETCTKGGINTSRYLGLRSSRKLLDCDTCTKNCEKIENMEKNGYIDATAFINCLEIVGNDEIPLYAGPMCGGNQGSRITIDVFEDEGCTIHDPSKNVEDYITDQDGHAFRISHHLLSQTYDNTEPIVCGTFDKDANTYTETKEVCTNLYEAASRYEQAQSN